MPSPVFLTGRFRSGSTLLWNLFRQGHGVTAYYEPLHPKLVHYLRHPPPPQSRHFHVESYFDEYPPAAELARHHSPELGVSRLHLEAQDEYRGLEAYLHYLLHSAGGDRTAVLKFNRIDLRLPWIRARFPEARIIHLARSPRDQWVSVLRGAAQDDDPDLEADPFHLTTWSRDLCSAFPFLASPRLRHLYQRHYYLCRLSDIAGSRLAHLSVSYEALLASPRETLDVLLAVAHLQSPEALEAGLRILVRNPGGAWRSYRDAAWFDDLETECDARLEELGLTARFGLDPLGDIVAASAAYREMAADPRIGAWPLRSAQMALAGLDLACDEKEGVIHDVSRAADERLAEMSHARSQAERLVETIKTLEKRSEAAESEAANRLQVLAAVAKRAENAEAAADARLRVIEEQDRALRAYRSRSLREWVRSFVSPRLGVLYQHPPRPLQMPQHYPGLVAASGSPRVSIVTPSYNQGRFIGRTIDSVLDQRYPGLEYLVQDGGSTDESVEVLKGYEGRLRYESAPDGGQANAINKAFARSTAEIMAYLNADDLLLPGALAYVGRFFARNPKVDVVYGHRVVVDEYDQEVGRWVLPGHDDAVLSYADYVPQETLFWRRSIWERAGGRVDETFHFALDWDLLLRFREAGARFARLPRFLGAFRVHPHQKTSAEMATRGAEEMERLRRQCHGRKLGAVEIHRFVRPYLVRHILFHKLYRIGLLRY